MNIEEGKEGKPLAQLYRAASSDRMERGVMLTMSDPSKICQHRRDKECRRSLRDYFSTDWVFGFVLGFLTWPVSDLFLFLLEKLNAG